MNLYIDDPPDDLEEEQAHGLARKWYEARIALLKDKADKGSARAKKKYLSVDTDIEDLEIDYIEVKLVTGETVTVEWDESDIAWEENGFDARYKGGISMRSMRTGSCPVSVRCRLNILTSTRNPTAIRILS